MQIDAHILISILLRPYVQISIHVYIYIYTYVCIQNLLHTYTHNYPLRKDFQVAFRLSHGKLSKLFY
jgi:hypothetical protein